MISFANPSWLYGLFGLLIPIGIHLLSRKEGKTIYIGSIRHLTDSDTAQFSSIRLNEILLLILRMLLITLLVFILAGLSFDNKALEPQRWLLVEKGVERKNKYKSIIDSLEKKGFEIRWLSDGFPFLKDSVQISRHQNYFKLIQRLPSTIDTTVVLTYSFANGFSGERVPLSDKIHWLEIEPENSEVAIDAIRLGNDSVSTRILKSNANGTTLSYAAMSQSAFRKLAKTESTEIRNRDTITVSIYATPKFEYDSKIIHAALLAIKNAVHNNLQINVASNVATIPSQSDYVFWLSEEKSVLKNVVVIGYAHCQHANLPLLVSQEEGEFCSDSEFDWVLTQRLNEGNVLSESFSYSLSKILLPRLNSGNAFFADHRTIPVSAAFSQPGSQGENATVTNPTATEPLLAILLFLILLAERFLAYKRTQ